MMEGEHAFSNLGVSRLALLPSSHSRLRGSDEIRGQARIRGIVHRLHSVVRTLWQGIARPRVHVYARIRGNGTLPWGTPRPRKPNPHLRSAPQSFTRGRRLRSPFSRTPGCGQMRFCADGNPKAAEQIPRTHAWELVAGAGRQDDGGAGTMRGKRADRFVRDPRTLR